MPSAYRVNAPYQCLTYEYAYGPAPAAAAMCGLRCPQADRDPQHNSVSDGRSDSEWIFLRRKVADTDGRGILRGSTVVVLET